MKEVLCVILGGGRGTRLFPLTKERCKPAVPLFGKYRLIDIPVSNCLNSGFNRIYILTQFNSESLNKHINRTYKLDAFTKGFVDIMAADQSMDDTNWFQGTADAVRRCLKHFNDPAIKYILVLGGDHLYQMDLMEMFRHHRDTKADVTVACNRITTSEAQQFGIMGMASDSRIVKFVEKPRKEEDIKDLLLEDAGGKYLMGSMGIYMFRKEPLIDLLTENSGKVDFGKEIIPIAIKNVKTQAYVYDGYWRDIGTIKTFYEENLLLTEDMPPMDLFDEKWQIYTRARYLCPAKFTKASVEKSIVSEGAIVLSARIVHSIIGLRFRVGAGTTIEDSVVMGCDYYETVEQLHNDNVKGLPHLGAGRNCLIRKAIIDKNVRIGDDVKIINEKGLEEFDGPNFYIRDGIVVIPKNSMIPSGTVI